ncbi:DUF4145 domain-containing protein [Curtobacterium sp. PhB172]|uniref:DUF4145 domain-containing protein n=1 Tax=Curtobacterium sp. PhB172 TaxID=2485196 RepID=UPI0016218F5C|nr:DUF4145 domain-containing protein [Curtobacterium sp. PhB172]
MVKELSVYAGDEVVAGYLTVDDTQGVFTVVGTELMKSSDAAKHNGVLLEWHLSVCAACSQGSVWRGDELIYPSRSRTPPPHEAMPEGAKQLYVEAAAVLPHSRRAAAALARAALERLLRALPESSPEARLDDLIAKLSSVVSPTLWKLLTVVRYVGNDSLHGDGSSELVGLYLEGDAAELVEPVFGAINSIVEEVIVQPAEAERLYSMIPEGVRLNAEKKRDRTD